MTKLTPRPEQEEAIQRILAEPTKAALIADETGFGKTLTASEVIVRAGWARVLIIGIGATFPQWKERLAEQSDGSIQLRRMESNKAGRQAFDDFLAGKPGYYMATIQWLTQQDVKYETKTDLNGDPVYKVDRATGLATDKVVRERVRLETFRKMSNRKAGPVDAIVFDESHAIANRASQGRRTLLSIATEWKIAMSATFAGNLFENAWSTTRWLWPDLIPAYWTWYEQWCKVEPKVNADGREVWLNGKRMMEVTGEKEPEGSFVQSLPLYLRRERDEKAPEAVEILVDATPAQAAQYAELKAELLTWAMNFEGDREPLVVDIPAVLRTRLRQVALAELSFDANGEVGFAPNAQSAKLQALRGILDAWGDQPVVLATDSKKFAHLTAARMTAAGYAAEAWTGDASEKERARIKADFLAGKFKYLVMTIQSGGTGVDMLQTVCSKMVWLSVPDGDPKLEEQMLGRVFRPGMTDKYGSFQHVRLLVRDSVDVEVLANLVAKGAALRASTSAEALRNRAA